MVKANEAHLMRIREALSDTAAYGQVNWEDADISQVTNSKGQKVWRLKIVRDDGTVELHDFSDDDLEHNERLRNRVLENPANPATSNPRLSDPRDQKREM